MNDNEQGRGRSGGGKGHGNKNSNDKNNKNENKDERNKIKVPNEALKELGQNVHLTGKANQADEFAKTAEAIINCVRANHKRSEDVVVALRGPAEFDFDNAPDEPKAPVQKGKIDFNAQAGYECKVAFEIFQRRKEQCAMCH